jgi:two-component system chemotaxis response regulator CheY
MLDKRVLVVDDYATMRRIIRGLLSQIGFTLIEEAGDGDQAFTKLKEVPFGLVISDWNMPAVGGLDLLKRVRAEPTLKDLPFIMVTAESKTENVTAAREAGVTGYIVKPFNQETLKKKIEAALGVAA